MGNKKIIITERQLREISGIRIVENKETVNRSFAREYSRKQGKTDEEAWEIDQEILKKIPNVRVCKNKFMLGVTRMFLDDELRTPYSQMRMNQYLELIGTDEYSNLFDRNFNGISYYKLDKMFDRILKNKNFSTPEEEVKETENRVGSYRIVRIPSFDIASEYSDYTTWCVTKDESAYNDYTHHGYGIFYFCLRDGFESVSETPGKATPYDEYGLSMIAVSVNYDGSCNTITCRWNHANGGNDKVMSPNQLEKLLNVKFSEVFKPRTKGEIEKNSKKVFQEAFGECKDLLNLVNICESESFEPLFDEKRFVEFADNDYDFDNDDDDMESVFDNPKENLFLYSIDDNEDVGFIMIDANGDPVFDRVVANAVHDNGGEFIWLSFDGISFLLFNAATRSFVSDEKFSRHLSFGGKSYAIVTVGRYENILTRYGNLLFDIDSGFKNITQLKSVLKSNLLLFETYNNEVYISEINGIRGSEQPKLSELTKIGSNITFGRRFDNIIKFIPTDEKYQINDPAYAYDIKNKCFVYNEKVYFLGFVGTKYHLKTLSGKDMYVNCW